MVDLNPVVYIVDDDASVRKSLERLIRSVNLTSKTFSSAKEFLKHSIYKGPCCLVLDIRLPGASGLDLQTTLSKQDQTPPIIFITGHGDIKMSVQAMKKGAVDFLTKPFNDQDLLDAIHKALEQDSINKLKLKNHLDIKTNSKSLTNRELEVFHLVTSGMLNKQVASELGISEKTVKVHRASVMRKMNATSLADLVRMSDILFK